MTLLEKLEELGALSSPKKWVKKNKVETMKKLWEQYDDGHELLWLLVRTGNEDTVKKVILFVVERIKPMMEKIPEEEKRPRKAIEITEAWAKGEDIEKSILDAAYSASHDYSIECAGTSIRPAAYAAEEIVEAVCRYVESDIPVAADLSSLAAFDTSGAILNAEKCEKEYLKKMADEIREQFQCPEIEVTHA